MFRAIGMALIGKVGGASGPLYGSLFLGMGKELGDATEVEDERLAAALRAGYDSVVARGKAQLEDKTMLDAWHPALDALDAPWPRARSWARPWTRPRPRPGRA